MRETIVGNDGEILVSSCFPSFFLAAWKSRPPACRSSPTAASDP